MSKSIRAERVERTFLKLLLGSLFISGAVALLGIFAEVTGRSGDEQVSALFSLTAFGLGMGYIAFTLLSLVVVRLRKVE